MFEPAPRGIAVGGQAALGHIEDDLLEADGDKDIGHLYLPKDIAELRRDLAAETNPLQVGTAGKDMFHHMELGIVGQHHLLEPRVAGKGTVLHLVHSIFHA